jgi:HEAT repeat protein
LTCPPATRALRDATERAVSPLIRSSACLALAERQPDRAAASALKLALSAEARGQLDASRLERLLRLVAREGGEPAIRRLATAGSDLPDDLREVTLVELRARHEHGDDPAAWRAMLQTDRPRYVDLAVRRLGELGEASAVNDLIRTFGRIDRRRAPQIPLALGRIGSPQALPFLTELVSSDLYATPSLLVTRQTAAWALPRCGADEQAVPALRVMAARGGDEILPALVALAKIRGTEALEDLYALKARILRHNTSEAVAAHESVNWVIREIRAGRSLARLDRPPRSD